MCPYDELLQHKTEQLHRHEQYRANCIDFTAALFEAFIKYLGCAQDRIQFAPLGEEAPSGPSPFSEMRMLDDGRLGVWVLLRLDKEPGFMGLEGSTFRFPYLITEQDGKFIVQIGDQTPQFALDESSPDEWVGFFRHVVQSIRDALSGDYRKPQPTGIAHTMS